MATTVLKRLAIQGYPDLAAKVLSAMALHGIESNAFHYSAALSACASDGQWLLALRLVQSMEASSTQKDAYVVSSHLRASAQAGQWRSSLNLVQEMCRSSCRLDTVACNACSTSCQHAGMWQKSWRILRRMTRSELEADLLTCNALSAAPWPKSMLMLGFATREALQPDAFCLNSAISKADEACWHDVLSIIDAMTALELEPDVATYAASFESFGKAPWQAASEVWRFFQGTYMSDAAALTAMLGTCASTAQWQAALELHQGPQQVDLISHNALLSACAKGYAWLPATLLFVELPRLRMLPDDVTRSSLLASLSAAGRWELALAMFTVWTKTWSLAGVSGAIVGSTLMSALAAGGQWEVHISENFCFFLGHSELHIFPHSRGAPTN